jgi:3-phenylpropionate/cinnamic acid dioxygenase small subunit
MASMLEEKDAIRDLLAAYCFYIDGGELDKWAGLFTEDCTFDVGALGKAEGRAAIKEFVSRARTADTKPFSAQHCTLNSLIRINGAEARADSYVLVVREGEQRIDTVLAGRYEDLIVKQADNWRFKVRKVHLDIATGLAPRR